MIFTRTALPANPLTHRLLTSASLSALVLAGSLSFASPAGAVDQEITGNAENTANLLTAGAANDIISGNTGGQFGAIDTHGSVTFQSITLTQSETLAVFDSAGGGGDIATVTNDFILNAGVTGTLIFSQAQDGTAADDAILAINGNLGGPGNSQGGDLVISGRDAALSSSSFTVAGNTNVGAVTVNGGDADTASSGTTISTGFGNADADSFMATSLSINGGNGDAVDAGSGQTGGQALVSIDGSATITGAVTLTGGADGLHVGDNGRRAVLSFVGDAVTITIGGPLTLQRGTDGNGAGAPGAAGLVLTAATLNANGGIVFNSDGGTPVDAQFYINGTSNQTINGDITAATNGSGEIVVENFGVNRTITFTGSVGTETMRLGLLELSSTDILTFQGNTFANALDVTTGSTAQFQGSMSTLGGTSGGGNIVIGDGTSTASLTLEGTALHTGTTTINGMGTLVVNDLTGAGITLFGDIVGGAADGTTTLRSMGAAGTNTDFRGDVGTTNPIGAIDVDATTRFSGSITAINLDVATGAIVRFESVTSTIQGDLTGGGTVVSGDGAFDELILGTAGQTSTVSVAGISGTGRVRIANDANVVISTEIGGGNQFALEGANTVVTFNSMAATSVRTVTSVIDGSTIILGSNIGNGDTVFRSDLNHGGGTATTVQLSANVQNGDAITLIDGTAADTIDNTEFGNFTVTDTALTDFTLARTADGGTANANLVITAAATTSAQAAAILGVSTGQADALRQAVAAAVAIGDTTSLDALTLALNTGGAQATQVAQQIGPQSETSGGGAQTATELNNQLQQITQDRLGGFRSSDPAFAFTGNGETGFAGGDLDTRYSQLAVSAPRYAGSLWFQGFGGVADADGDANAAGYDAAFGGAMVGIDGAVTDDITIGAFGSVAFSSVDGDGAGNAQLDATTFTIGAYGSYTAQHFYLDAFASYAASNNDVSRTALAQAITGDFDAHQFAIGAALGVPFEVSQDVFITPNASLTYNHYEADSYTETGSAGFSAIVNPGSVSQLTGTFSARVHAVYEQPNGTTYIPELRLGVIGDLIDDDAVSTATFVGGGTAFNVTGTDTDDVGALVGLGLSVDHNSWSAGVSYDADIRSDYTSHTARVEFRLRF